MAVFKDIHTGKIEDIMLIKSETDFEGDAGREKIIIYRVGEGEYK